MNFFRIFERITDVKIRQRISRYDFFQKFFSYSFENSSKGSSRNFFSNYFKDCFRNFPGFLSNFYPGILLSLSLWISTGVRKKIYSKIPATILSEIPPQILSITFSGIPSEVSPETPLVVSDISSWMSARDSKEIMSWIFFFNFRKNHWRIEFENSSVTLSKVLPRVPPGIC